jgi:3-dehydroquinate dehydratase II
MTRSISILNGPNLNLLGQREPEIHGRTMLAETARLGVKQCRQINGEGKLGIWIQQLPRQCAGLVLKAGAYSQALIARRAMNEPLIEVHLSNIYQRETFRQHSYVSPAAKGLICGFGSRGCLMALGALVAMSDDAH